MAEVSGSRRSARISSKPDGPQTGSKRVNYDSDDDSDESVKPKKVGKILFNFFKILGLTVSWIG